MSKQLAMLKKMIDFIICKEQCNNLMAFKKLLDYIGIKIHVDTAVVFSSKNNIFADLDKIFDLEILKSDEWDWLGELLIILKLNKNNLEKREIEVLNLNINIGTFPYVILAKDMLTGRKVLKLHSKYGNNIIFYGICNDIILYHISLINCKLYNINSILLYSSKKEVEYQTNSKNWLYANRWNPVNISLLN